MAQNTNAPRYGVVETEPGTMAQSVDTNMTKGEATVAKLLARKGVQVFSIGPDASLAEAVVMLRDKGIGALVVTGPDGSLAGVLSERDIVRKLAETPGQTLPQSVAENMTADVKSCTPGDTLVPVLQAMSDGGFRHMPVVENGKLCGMLTIGDVVRHRLEEVEYEALQMKQLIVG